MAKNFEGFLNMDLLVVAFIILDLLRMKQEVILFF